MDWIFLLAGFLMALVAGVFLSFSDFVMRGLVQAPDAAGANGMIGLNRTVYRSVFMVLLMGFVPGSLALAAAAALTLEGPLHILALVGATSYLLGVIAVTGAGNVPMNTALDRLADQPGPRAEAWPHYARRWTLLNHLRVLAAGLAAAAWLGVAGLS